MLKHMCLWFGHRQIDNLDKTVRTQTKNKGKMQDECASEIDQVGRQRPLVGDRQHHSTKQLGGMHRDYLLVLLCGTWELASLPSVFLALGIQDICRVLEKYTRRREIQSTFWSSKLIQIKKRSTAKLYNFSRCTTFILVISSFDKAIVTLFTKFISLI